MYKRWKENKGVTLVSLVILVTILLIVSTTIILNVNDRYKSQKLDKLASDLQLLTEKASIYYAQNKYYPIVDGAEAVNITISGSTVSIYKIDLAKLQGLTLNYGGDYKTSENDYYGIDTSTGAVYYKQGIEGVHNLAQAEKIEGISIVKITTQPQWQTVEDGETATLSVALNIPEGVTVSYQWYASDTYNGQGTPISGATSSTLTIESASTDNAKYYYCVIIYNDIAKKTDVAKLDVESFDIKKLPQIQDGGYTGTKNCRYEDGGQIAVIPAGFTVSNVASEKTIAGGLVIYSGNHSAVTDMTTVQGTANQYVWIPVENPSDIYGTLESPVEGIEGTKFGKLYDVNSTKTALDKHYNWPTETGYYSTLHREPAILSSYDTSVSYYKTILGYNSVEEYTAGMVQEFNDMITSVEKYKGFYIGRYELTGTVEAPTVKKGLTPLGKTKWYNFYKACTDLETANANAKDKVRTTMIWGCQWDQAVKKAVVDEPTFLSSPEPFGWYSNSVYTENGGNGTKGIQVTGLKQDAYNIYDMGGNVYDWTLGAYGTDYRTHRGSGFSWSSDYPASDRSFSGPYNGTESFYGCRSQLYIK